MNSNDLQINGRRLRMLVGITSFGEKNIEMLRRVIRNYQSLPLDVDIVVLSNAPKELGPNVRVVVGLPTKNPWSLPFAHKPVFAENPDRYDLFVYTEEDIELTEAQIRAFLRATPQLAENEIAGFQLYEVDAAGKATLPGVHGAFRWRPESVARRGEYLVADFNNEHSAFYMLTQAQMKRALASGGYLRPVCEGRYDIACTASTDPYTNCGFRKVLCISAVDDFLLHHLPNRYAGKLGVTLEMFKAQIETLTAIHAGKHPNTTLCEAESKLLHTRWSKNLYEKPDNEFLKLIPHGAKTILSIGCGWGATEGKLQERGAKVTALPMDSVIGAWVARQGVEVIYGTLAETIAKLQGRKFDCAYMSNLLHLLPEPERLLGQVAGLISQNGSLVISGPNINSLKVRVKRVLGREDYGKLADFSQGGISVFSPGKLAKHLRNSGFRVTTVQLPDGTIANGDLFDLRGCWRGLNAPEWMLQARR